MNNSDARTTYDSTTYDAHLPGHLLLSVHISIVYDRRKPNGFEYLLTAESAADFKNRTLMFRSQNDGFVKNLTIDT